MVYLDLNSNFINAVFRLCYQYLILETIVKRPTTLLSDFDYALEMYINCKQNLSFINIEGIDNGNLSSIRRGLIVINLK